MKALIDKVEWKEKDGMPIRVFHLSDWFIDLVQKIKEKKEENKGKK